MLFFLGHLSGVGVGLVGVTNDVTAGLTSPDMKLVRLVADRKSVV